MTSWIRSASRSSNRSDAARVASRRYAGALFLLAAFAASVMPVVAQAPPAQSDADQPAAPASVAVLGFTNLTGDMGLRWLDPGTVESVRSGLRSLGFRVVGAEAVRAALATRGDPVTRADGNASAIGAALDLGLSVERRSDGSS